MHDDVVLLQPRVNEITGIIQIRIDANIFHVLNVDPFVILYLVVLDLLFDIAVFVRCFIDYGQHCCDVVVRQY